MFFNTCSVVAPHRTCDFNALSLLKHVLRVTIGPLGCMSFEACRLGASIHSTAFLLSKEGELLSPRLSVIPLVCFEVTVC